MANSKTFPKPGAYLLSEAGLVRPDGRPAERVAGKDRVLVSRGMGSGGKRCEQRSDNKDLHGGPFVD